MAAINKYSNRKPITLADDRDPWEKQPNETDRQYGYFRSYRDLGLTRTVVKVADQHGKRTTYLNWMSHVLLWSKRAYAWDDHLDEQWKKEVKEERKKMAREHAEIANLMLKKVTERLNQIEIEEIKPAEIAKWLDIGVKVKRASFGDPEYVNVEISGPEGEPLQVDIMDKRQRLLDLREELNRRVLQGKEDDDE